MGLQQSRTRRSAITVGTMPAIRKFIDSNSGMKVLASAFR